MTKCQLYINNKKCRHKAGYQGEIGASKINLCLCCYEDKIQIQNIHNFRDRIENVKPITN